MRTFFGFAFFAGCVALAWVGAGVFEGAKRTVSDDPTVWEPEIQAFVADTESGLNADQPIVFVGSSSIRFWRTLEEDLAPLPVINRGFGGSRLGDIEYWSNELVNINDPRAVVVFCGTNDIRPDKAAEPAELLETLQRFVAKIRRDDDTLPIYYIAITPSPKRWEVWPIAQETNRLIQEWINTQSNMKMLDTSPYLLGEDGTPDPSNYLWDELHLDKKGYEIWRATVKALLMQDFA